MSVLAASVVLASLLTAPIPEPSAPSNPQLDVPHVAVDQTRPGDLQFGKLMPEKPKKMYPCYCHWIWVYPTEENPGYYEWYCDDCEDGPGDPSPCVAYRRCVRPPTSGDYCGASSSPWDDCAMASQYTCGICNGEP